MPDNLLSSGLDLQRLNELACLLEAAGDDGATISLRRSDCVLLGLKPGDSSKTEPADWVDITRTWTEAVDGKIIVQKSKKSILRCEAIVAGNGVIRSCLVHVGTAREAVFMLRGDTPIADRRQPDIQAPITQPESAGRL